MRTHSDFPRAHLGLFLAAVMLPAAATAQEVVRIDGSTGVKPLVSALADAFMKQQPGISIEIGEGLGGKARIEALEGGAIDIATASHGLKIDELTKKGMAVHQIAVTPVVFATNSSVGITALSEDEVCSIYAGTITNWSELKGPDLPVAVFTRPDSEVDAEVVLEGVSCFEGVAMPASVRVTPKADDMARALETTRGAIGMTTSTMVEQSGGKITPIALNGIYADEANLRAGNYKLVREAFLVVGESPSEAVSAFLAFVASPEGGAVTSANGAFPVRK
jgi:phosphate transport system substrate-binding protein